MDQDIPDYVGHRKRLRERFVRNLGSDMADYEALELLLTYAIPRKDVKPLAKQLIKRFGSFAGVVSAPINVLQGIDGIKENVAVMIKFVEFAAQKLAWENLAFDEIPVISSRDMLLEYCRCVIGHGDVEVFRLIYVDAKLRVMDSEVLQKGSISSVCINHRDVVAKALAKNAAGVIMVHNHPSGDPRPSTNDVEVTKKVKSACNAAGIELFEHIIITPSSYFSFMEHGILTDK